MWIKNPTDATVCRYLFTAKVLYMFRVSQHPSSGVSKFKVKKKKVCNCASQIHSTGTTVKQHIYAVVLQCLQESVWWRWSEKWWPGDWFLHHDILLLTLHFSRIHGNNGITRGAQIPRLPVVQATKYFMVVPRICESSLCTFFHVTHLAPRILRWFLEFWKICASMGMTCPTPFILPRSSTL